MTTLTTERLAELRRVAEAAETSGPWEYVAEPVVLSELGKEKAPDMANWKMHRVRTSWIHGQAKDKLYIGYGITSPYTDPVHDVTFDEGDAKFIAAFDPPTALALLAALAEAQHEVARCHASIADLPVVLSDAGIHDDSNYAGMVRLLVADRDRLAARIADLEQALKSYWMAYGAVREADKLPTVEQMLTAERDRLAKQVEAMKAQLGAMQECATMFVEGHGWLENADSQEDWNKGWAIIEKAKLAAPELLHSTVGIDIIALRKQVSAMTEALTNIHNMAVEELRRFDDTELQGHMVWQIEADARAALSAQEGK